MNSSCHSPRVQAVLFGFSLICSRGGGTSAAAVTLDTVDDESRKKMADGVARSPSRLCRRDGKKCRYGDTLSTIFLLACFCALLPTFRFSFLLCLLFGCIPICLPSCPLVCAAASTLSTYVFYGTCSFTLMCHLYPTSFRNSSVFFSFSIFFEDLTSQVASTSLLCSRTR